MIYSERMLLLVSGATKTIRERPDKRHLGHLLTPKNGNSINALLATGLPIACDNYAFGTFDEPAFLRMLDNIKGKRVLWVTAPDVVADAAATLALFDVWEPVIRAHELPVALVAQDGLQDHGVPWERMDALFIGGSTAWKLGRDAARVVGEAKARGSTFTEAGSIRGGASATWRKFLGATQLTVVVSVAFPTSAFPWRNDGSGRLNSSRRWRWPPSGPGPRSRNRPGLHTPRAVSGRCAPGTRRAFRRPPG